MDKSYLSRQIKLVTLNSYDLFTQEECDLFTRITFLRDRIDELKREKDKFDPTREDDLDSLKKEKIETVRKLELEIKKKENCPRAVNVQSVMECNAFNQGERIIRWDNLKLSRRICEFESEESRLLGIEENQVTFDKIIVKWKYLDILRQIVKNGFDMTITEDGEPRTIHYIAVTASAGQLRTDKLQFLSEEGWNRIKDTIQCGIDWDEINKHGGINVNKFLAYLALSSSATDQWDLDIDRCIVIKDFETPVTAVMDYIKPDYTIERGERTVIINHIDGAGMMLPSVSDRNFMVRLPYIKGLLSPFDFIEFCRVHNIEPIIEDRWGTIHDLVKENIQVIFTDSQFKLAKFYNSWEHYKECYKRYHCHACRTNYEEDYIPDTNLNYQMLGFEPSRSDSRRKTW